METYLVLIIILFILAASDLTVGVANDAVNFLNSAIGSKVAPRHIIILVAAFGVLVGTFFSSGMMEVARKGIFHPEMFKLNEIISIFLAVMFTDILLLDFFNTFGLPTSTTVSLISALFGSSVSLALIKIQSQGKYIDQLPNYINIEKTFGIFSAIIISVVISFVVGAIVQYISRLIFTFNYEKRLKKFGAIWGSLTLVAITYFIIVKGAKGSSFMTSENIKWINSHFLSLLAIVFVVFAIVLQLILFFTKINIFKPIVLIGTFSLALAFAANDLVNFIGVPLAGLSSYQIAMKSGNPLGITMSELNNLVGTNNYILFVAGIIMIITLWFNKKARTVTQTSIDLGRQFEGFEKFESIKIAREIVRSSISFGNLVRKIIPNYILDFIDKRFDIEKSELTKKVKKEKPAFDLLRASVNLMVSSSLISLGTAYKLPLSTTYVTFMVAMATSFSDRAWGRESAVYRVSGVMTVIGGWFLTAFIAIVISGLIAFVLYLGGIYTALILGLIAVGMIIKTNIIHTQSQKKIQKLKEAQSSVESNNIVQIFESEIKSYFDLTKKIYSNIHEGLIDESRKKLKKSYLQSQELEKDKYSISAKIVKAISSLPESSFNDNNNFGKLISSIDEICNSISWISEKAFEHVDNNHSGLTKSVKENFNQLEKALDKIFDGGTSFIKKLENSKLEQAESDYLELKKLLKKIDKNISETLIKGDSKPRANLLFLSILYKSEIIAVKSLEILQFYKEFRMIK